MRGRAKTLVRGPREFNSFSPLRVVVNRFNHRFAAGHLGRYPQVAILAFDHIGLRINVEGRYEGRYLEMLARFLAGFDLGNRVALDVGANIGNHSVLFAEMFRRVFAFEPNPRVFELLRFNARFACPKGNVECHNFGLSNAAAKIELHVDASNLGGGAIDADPTASTLDDVSIEVRTLDSLEELTSEDVAFVKIDVEGHELQVLEGARELLARNRPILTFEQHASEITNGTSPAIDFLRSSNYRFATIENNFFFGEAGLQKALGLLARTVFGSRLTIVQRDHFPTRFYDMILAIPTEVSERLA